MCNVFRQTKTIANREGCGFMIFLIAMGCFVKKEVIVPESMKPAVSNSDIVKAASDEKLKIEMVLRPKKPKVGDVITLDIHVHTTIDIDVNMPVLMDSIDELVVLETSYSGGGDSEGYSYSGKHYVLEASKAGWNKIPAIHVSYKEKCLGQDAPSKDIYTKSFRYVVRDDM
jgi:hypothetical protein